MSAMAQSGHLNNLPRTNIEFPGVISLIRYRGVFSRKTGMRRREFISIFGGAVALPLAAYGQQRSKNVAQIGFLTRKTDASVASQINAFRQGLQDLGWVEGKNITIQFRDAGGQLDRLGRLAGRARSLLM